MTNTPENEVPSLELCRQMKELSFSQEGIWYWCNHHTLPIDDCDKEWYVDNSSGMLDRGIYPYHKILAPTTAQMGRWAGQHLGNFRPWYNDESEPDYRAKMLIHLAKEGLINPKELKP